MAPGRFRRRLSDDHSDVAESSAGTSEAASSTRSWLDGTGSTRGRLPWLSPRERRHPLRDVRLSCFRSYLPGSIGGGSSDGDLLSGESSPRTPRTPRTPRLPASGTGTPQAAAKGLSLSVRRSPGRSRAGKASENVYPVSPPRPQPAQPAQHEAQQQPSPQSAAKHSGSGGGANLSARLRALSARCLALVHANKATITQERRSARSARSARPCKQRSFSSGALPGLHDFQRRQLNPIYRDDGDDQLDDEQTPLSPSPSNGVLCGDEDGDSGILVSEATSTPLSSLPGLPGCGGNGSGGGDAGRGSLPWAGSVGALGAATAAARALRSASLDRELLGPLSPLLDHEEDPDEPHCATSQARRSRASTKSASASSEISEIFSRFQRRRVAGSCCPTAASRPSSPSSSPPLLPAPPQRADRADAGGAGRRGAGRWREFHLVRLTRAEPTEELGIFIAKQGAAPDGGAQGYVVAHVVPGGLAHRDGQLRLGDELVVVNGRQLRGLSMAAARQRLRAGPTQVDIVIARASADRCQCQSPEGRDSGLDTSGSGDSMTEGCGPCCRRAGKQPPDHTPSPARRNLLESSVDYENVVLRPRDRTPVPSSESSERASPATASAEQRSTATLATSPTAASSPSPSPVPGRQQLFQKHTNSASTKAVVSSSPPLEAPAAPAETQHHSLKRRGRRHGARLDAVGGPPAPSAEFHVELRKGPGCGALGFTVVGGADSPRGALPIFVRSVLEGGQAARDARLHPGDELLTLNGQPLRGATHAEAVAMFRAVRAGPVLLTACRRTAKKAQSCSDLVVGQPQQDGG